MVSRFHENMPGRSSPEDALLDSYRSPPNPYSFTNHLNPGASFDLSQRSGALDPGVAPNTKTINYAAYSREPSPGLGDDFTSKSLTTWRTRWLDKATLLSMAILYLALAGSLIGLWLSNKHQEGFSTSLSTNHYSWTYGPTAILVIFLSLWRQVDYYAKVTQPWQVLQSPTPVVASKSVLLDYVSPLQITSFWRAVKRHHYPVAASVAGFGILKLVILVSTGLLVLTPVPTSLPITVEVTTQFSMDRVLNETFEGAVNDSPVQSYLGAITDEMPYPPGTLDDRAFQRIDWPFDQDVSDLLVELDVFVPKVTCEIAEVRTRKFLDPGILYVEMDTPSCSVGHEDQDDMDLNGGQQNGRGRATDSEDPQFFTYYDLWRVNCSGPEVDVAVISLDNTTQDDIRHAMVVSNISAWSRTEGSGTVTDQTSFDLSGIICKVDYSIDHLPMLHNRAGDAVNVSVPGDSPAQTDGRHLEGFNGVMLAEQVMVSLTKAVSISFPDDDGNHFASVPLFWTMLKTLEGDESLNRFLDPQILQRSAEKVWTGLAAQLARDVYAQSAQDTVDGEAMQDEQKLRIGIVSLWVMIGGFTTLAILSILLAFTVRQGVIAEDPRLISSTAAMVSASLSSQETFRGTGPMRKSQLKESLQGYAFQTSFQKGFQLVAHSAGEHQSPEIKVKDQPWTPLSTKYWMIGVMLISPLVVIAVLEVLQRISDDNQGIADVTGSEDVAGYLSHYLSASLILLLATSINNFDFTITSFAPYSILRSGAAPASRSINFTLLGELAPVALVKSLRKHHYSSTFSNVAGVVGSVLTIVVSGLWTIDHSVLGDSDVSIPSTSAWDIAWLNSSTDDGGAARAFDQIQHGAASIPQHIWGDLVFPNLDEIDNVPEAGTRNFSLAIEALRPELTCEIATDDEIEIEFWTDEDEHEWLRFTALPRLPAECRRGGAEGTKNYANFSRRIEYYDFNAGYWDGAFYDIHMGPWDESSNTTLVEAGETEPPNPLQPDNPHGCPSIGFIWATSHGENTTKSDVMGLLCSQKLQSITVTTSYDGSTNPPTLLTIPPPIPDESTARYLTNGTSGIDSFPFRIQPHINGDMTKFPGENTDPDGHSTFFSHLLYGPDSPHHYPVAAMLGRANRQTFIDAATYLYKQYMVHVIDQHFRTTTSPPAAAPAGTNLQPVPEITGTASTSTSRLTMNRGSKVALQAMLGAVAVLGAAAFATSDLRGTLPRGPYSIASVVALVVGMDAAGGGKEGGGLYSLGWWPAGGAGGSVNMVEMSELRGQGWQARNEAVLQGRRGEVTGTRRFGIDVGMPEELGYRRTRWWEVRRRVVARVRG